MPPWDNKIAEKRPEPVEWPTGPSKNLYFEQKEALDRWQFEFDVEGMGSFGDENRFGLGGTFTGDIWLDDYFFLVGYKYFFSSKLPHEFKTGGGKRKNWGDYRVSLIGQIPSFTDSKLIKDIWRLAVSVMIVYDIVDTPYFRLSLTGETGLETDKFQSFGSFLNGGLLMGIRN